MDCIGITGDAIDFADFRRRLLQALRTHSTGSIGVIYRDRPLLAADNAEWQRRWQLVRDSCSAANIAVWAAAGPEVLAAPNGLHLSSEAMRHAKAEPLAGRSRIGASCHSPKELQQAARLNLDYVFVSPVQPPGAHPSPRKHLGMEGLGRLAADCAIPVYALGGMTPEHLRQAQRAGAAGIAGISWFWPENQA